MEIQSSSLNAFLMDAIKYLDASGPVPMNAETKECWVKELQEHARFYGVRAAAKAVRDALRDSNNAKKGMRPTFAELRTFMPERVNDRPNFTDEDRRKAKEAEGSPEQIAFYEALGKMGIQRAAVKAAGLKQKPRPVSAYRDPSEAGA